MKGGQGKIKYKKRGSNDEHLSDDFVIVIYTAKPFPGLINYDTEKHIVKASSAQ